MNLNSPTTDRFFFVDFNYLKSSCVKVLPLIPDTAKNLKNFFCYEDSIVACRRNVGYISTPRATPIRKIQVILYIPILRLYCEHKIDLIIIICTEQNNIVSSYIILVLYELTIFAHGKFE